jgi:hypothetical protein
MKQQIAYKDAGVDIDAASRATEKIKELARKTFNERTLSEIGSFGGMFDGSFPDLRQPVLVASADGVGTKLKIAFMAGIQTPWERTWLIIASMTFWSRVRVPFSSWITLRLENCRRKLLKV